MSNEIIPYLAYADAWQRNVQAWTATTNGPYSSNPYYLRLTKDANPNAATTYDVGDSADFERVYGPEGEWAQFFREGVGYIGTELLRDIEEHDRYLVIDRWESIEAYNEFIAENQVEYLRRSDESRIYYLAELRFGAFENVWAE